MDVGPLISCQFHRGIRDSSVEWNIPRFVTTNPGNGWRFWDPPKLLMNRWMEVISFIRSVVWTGAFIHLGNGECGGSVHTYFQISWQRRHLDFFTAVWSSESVGDWSMFVERYFATPSHPFRGNVTHWKEILDGLGRIREAGFTASFLLLCA